MTSAHIRGQLVSTSLLAIAAAMALGAGSAAAQAVEAGSQAVDAADAAGSKVDPENIDYGATVSPVEVSALSGPASSSPVKAPLNSTEPTSMVDRKAIDQFIPTTADYTQIINLTPSVSGVAFNGPGLSEAKSTLRGFQDGQYNVTYDGIPWGDANGPTHHSTSFFPSSTIGGVVVERGPGEAGELGQATFGGTVNMFSPVVSAVAGGSQAVTYGSWDTVNSVTKLNTGTMDKLNGARLLINLQELRTRGYLSTSGASATNQLVRAVVPLAGDWNMTVLGTWNNTKVHTADSPGATLTQVALYGKDFGLTNDPTLPTFAGYNIVRKHTYFMYDKVAGTIMSGLTAENTLYKYYYKNDTESALDVTLSPADIAAKKGLQVTLTPGGAAVKNGDVPGYTKLNIYKIYGDVLRLNQETPWGTLKGGLWVERADTGPRARYDYDATQGRIPDYRQPVLAGVPQNVEYVQFSGWDHYEPFVDFEWKPTPALTITPGIKYVNFDLHVDADINQKSRQPFHSSRTFTKTLEYLTANYRLRDNLSVYGQYATGFLIPDISITQVTKPNLNDLKPQTSTNYQAGFVYQGSLVSIDADVYRITFKNKQQSRVNAVTGETEQFNLGGATYSGVEGQITYKPSANFYVFANGSINDAKTKGEPSLGVVGDKQIANAPKSTASLGAVVKAGGLTASLLDKYVGPQWAAEGEPAAYKIKGYHSTDLTLTYNFGNYRLEAAAYNLFDSQQATSIKPGKTTPYDQYFFQPERNFQVSAKVNF